MKLHLDLHAGISGDMFLAACLDLGLPHKGLKKALKSLGLPKWVLKAVQEVRGGMAGTRLDIEVPKETEHRRVKEIHALIEASGLSEGVKGRAKGIFTLLALVEGQVHGIDPEAVHFHEVGAADAILDICGAAYAIETLGIREVTASPLCAGRGEVDCDHGVMPVPVPAVAEMVRRFNVPLIANPPEGEWATPTGVAILCHLDPAFGAIELGSIDRIGVGLGGREIPGRANGLRLLLSEMVEVEEEPVEEIYRDEAMVLTANIDDMNPEWYGPLWAQLFDAGALDVSLAPLTMKKNRPGSRLEVIAPPPKEEEIARLILRETSSLGVRARRERRWVQARQSRVVETPWGPVRIKRGAGGVWGPEHDDLADLAEQRGVPLARALHDLYPCLPEEDGEGDYEP